MSFARFAEFAYNARTHAFSQRARKMAVDAITDCVGCQLAGLREPLADIVFGILPCSTHRTEAMPVPVLGKSCFAAPTDAALFGGALAHALDYDDTNHPAYAHPSAVLAPALFSAAQICDAKGSDLIAAYIIGLELLGKLGRAFNPGHYKAGWHATKSFGVLSAAIAVCALFRTRPESIETALAIAGSSASGLRANFGTMVKPLHAGQAAQAGVTAALLAHRGFSASRDALDHQYGYAALFGATETDVSILQSPGQPLEILSDYGLAIKPYPSCGATHPAIEAAVKLRSQIGERAILSVRVGVPSLAFAPLIYERPDRALEGKFSMRFCVSAALAAGTVTIDTFNESVIADPQLRHLMSITSVEADDRVEGSTEFASIVSVAMSDGSIIEERIDLAKGKPQRWLSDSELNTKFVDCAARTIGDDSAKAAYGILQNIESAETVREAVDQLASVCDPHGNGASSLLRMAGAGL